MIVRNGKRWLLSVGGTMIAGLLLAVVIGVYSHSMAVSELVMLVKSINERVVRIEAWIDRQWDFQPPSDTEL